MPIRKLKLPQDFSELAEMLPNSFQYPENPEWSVQEDEREGLEQSIKSLQKSWWLMRIGRVLLPSMRDILSGFVWEENGKIAGCAILQPHGQSSLWLVGTIATRPEYRRRGIARQLVTASLEMFREKQGTIATLGVIEGNLPAYTLYQKLGFETFSGHYDLEFRSNGVYPMPELPAEFELRPSGQFSWKPRFELRQRITPVTLLKYEPLDEKRFKVPFFMRLLIPLLNRVDKTKEESLLIYHRSSGELIGTIRSAARLSGKGRHSCSLTLDPAFSAQAEIFLQYMLHKLSAADPQLIIEFGVPQWQDGVYQAAKDLGFTTRLTYQRMGILLE